MTDDRRPKSRDRESDTRSVTKVAFASFVGTTIEWYDFFLYGTAAALVFNRLFFPTFDQRTGTMAAFGTYSVGFFARPVGGIVCGHFGDRVGRKSMLVFTLLVMGIATFLIGLLPTYATAGAWAPALLVALRFIQGFGVGGEWGGAALMAVEHAPKGRRGFYGSFPQMGVPAGLLLAALVFRVVSSLPEPAFLAWGWRAAFLLSLALVGVGMFIRLSVSESPEFERVRGQRAQVPMPVLEALKRHPREILLAMGARLAENGAFYIFSVFVLTYAEQYARVPASLVLGAILAAAGLELVTMPALGVLSDRVGRRPVYLAGAAATALIAFPFFRLVGSGSPFAVVAALILALPVCHAAMYGPQASFFSELFGASVRYSGASLGYQLSSVIAGGLSPLLAASLIARSGGDPAPVAWLLVAMSAATVVSVWLAKETAGR